LRVKKLYIIAGANGSGKTTFAMNFAQLNDLKFINADEIAKEYDPDNIYKYKMKAGKEFFSKLYQALLENNSFIIETTLSGKYLIKIIKKAKEYNFKVVLVYIFLETDIENIYRVKNRVLKGGHNVPVNDIIRRYHRSRRMFTDIYIKLADEWMLIFNGDDSFVLVEDQDEIYDEELKEVFLRGRKNE